MWPNSVVAIVLLLATGVETCRVTIPGLVRANCVPASFGNTSRPVVGGQLFLHEHGCERVAQPNVGGIMLVGRGGCSFAMKGWWAWKAGAKAIIIINDKDAEQFTMNVHPKELGAVPEIPLVLISHDDGKKLKGSVDGAQADVTLRLGKKRSVGTQAGGFERTNTSDACEKVWLTLLGVISMAALCSGTLSTQQIHSFAKVGVLATAAYCLAILWGHWEFGSIQGNWASKYYSQPRWASMKVFVGSCVLAFLLEKAASKLTPRMSLLLWFVGGLSIQCLLQQTLPWSMADLIVDDTANGFYGAVVTGELKNETLPSFLFALQNAVVPLPEHVRTNLPGKSTFFFAVRLLTDCPTTIALLIMAISNVGAFLVHQIAKELYGDERTARYAFVLYLFVPCKQMYFPITNTMCPVLILLCFYLQVRFLKSRSIVYALILGTTTYATAFFEPLPLVMGIMHLYFLGATLQSGSLDAAGLACFVGVCLFSFILLHLFMCFGMGYDLLRHFWELLQDANEFNQSANRPFSIWWKQNLIDFYVANGVCQTTLAIGCLGLNLREVLKGPVVFRSPAALLSFSLASTLIFLECAGINRGEVDRLWIFLASFYPLIVAHTCTWLPGNFTFQIVIVATLLQSSLTASLVMFAAPGGFSHRCWGGEGLRCNEELTGPTGFR
jgi:hypothetical protein